MRLVIHGGLTASLVLVVAASAAGQTPVQKLQLVPADTLTSLSWQSLATDPKGDAIRPRLPDAQELSYAIDSKADVVWFKVSVHGPLPERWFGINVAVDADSERDNGMVWWGTNKTKFDRLGSAYLFSAEGYWQGTAGVTDSEAAGQMLLSSITPTVHVALDRGRQAILLGIPRSALGTSPSVRVIATVGSMLVNNDDVPNEGAVAVKLTP